MSIEHQSSTTRGRAFLGCVPETIAIEGGSSVRLDPDHRAAIASDLEVKVRELYGGLPRDIRTALWSAMECTQRRLSRRRLLETLESSVSPALFASDSGLLKRLGEMVPGVLCESAGEMEAAGLNNDAAELMALAAVSIAESVREHQKVNLALQLGREPMPPETPYAEALAGMLKDRQVLPAAVRKEAEYVPA